MRHRPIQAAPRERVPFTLWGRTRIRTTLATVAASVIGLVPAVMVGSPAHAAPTGNIDDLQISNATNWGGGRLSFTLTYTGSTSGVFSFSTGLTANGGDVDATGGADLTATNDFISVSAREISFPAVAAGGSYKATLTVNTRKDTDPTEALALTATDANGATKSGTGTILGTDPNNLITLSGATTVDETATGGVQKTVTITAKQTFPQTRDVIVPVKTAAVTGSTDFKLDMATPEGEANRDYTALPADAVITIPANSTTGTTTVTLWDDNADETDVQNFSVNEDTARSTLAGGVTSAALGGNVISGQDKVKIGIRDDDKLPEVSIANAEPAVEGTYLSFPLNLTNPSEKGVGVEVAVAGEAISGTTAAKIRSTTNSTEDVLWTDGTAATVPSYAPSSNLMVLTTQFDDGPDFEGPEGVRATINLPSSPTASLGKDYANGIITDAGSGKTVYYGTATGPANNSAHTWTEGSTGRVEKKIFVKFDTDSPADAVLNYTFVDGTAKAGSDYEGKAGTVTVPKDATKEVTIPVTVIGDRQAEPSEKFVLRVTSPSGVVDAASLGDQEFTITDDDAAPSWTTEDVKVQEGNTGTTLARIPVRLTGPAAADVSFDATFANASAVDTTGGAAGENDFTQPINKVVTIKTGETVGYLDVPINGDEVFEKDQTFNVTFAMTSATASGNNVEDSADTTVYTSRVTVGNDDAQPKLTFQLGTVTEGGTLPVTGTVVGVSEYTYHLGLTVGGGATDPATPGVDFKVPDTLAALDIEVRRGESGLLTATGGKFAASAGGNGYPAQLIEILNDTIDEPNESISITANEISSILTGFATSSTTVKVADDPLDLPPAVAISDIVVNEKDGVAEVPVTLAFTGEATSSTQSVTIPFWTSDGTAKAGEDFKYTKGSTEVPANALKWSIKVPLINDPNVEGDEYFSVRLGAPGPLGASVINGDATVTVKSDDTGNPTGPGNPGTPAAPSIAVSGPSRGAGTATITGRTTPNTTVELWGAPLPASTVGALKYLTSVKSDASGNFRVTRSITTGHAFAVQANEVNSAVRTVKLTQNPTLAISSPSKGKLKVVVTGNPKAAGQKVTVQRLSGGKWVNLTTGTTTAANMTKTVSIKSKTKVTIRATVSGTSGINAATTAGKSVTIK